MNTRWILNKIPHRPIKYLATISYLKISSWFARWSSGEDAFCKGTPHGIILQLVNSCPHPVSRTLCASSPSSSFLSFSRHDPNSFIFFLFPLVLRSPIFDRAKRREKKKRRRRIQERQKGYTRLYLYIYIYCGRGTSQNSVPKWWTGAWWRKARWTLSWRHATKPSVYPLKIAMAITTRAFSRVQAAVRRRGTVCACKVRTYVRFIAKIQGDGSPRC